MDKGVLQSQLCNPQIPLRLLKLCLKFCLGYGQKSMGPYSVCKWSGQLTFGRKHHLFPLLVICLQIRFDVAIDCSKIYASTKLGRRNSGPDCLANNKLILVAAEMGPFYNEHRPPSRSPSGQHPSGPRDAIGICRQSSPTARQRCQG